MTVVAQLPINESIANGATSVFAYTFLVNAASDLLVQVDGLTKTLGVDYTVSGVGSTSGGNVTFISGNPANGTVVTRRRNMPLDRSTGYSTGGDLLAGVLNNDHDRHWLALQQLDARVGKSIQLPPGVSNVTLPKPTPLAPLVWNTAGTAIENGDLSVVGDLLLRLHLSQTGAGKGTDLLSYAISGGVARGLSSKLAEWKSVKDFGAVGDGVADDTTQIQTALTWLRLNGGGILLFPPGTYIINQSLHIGSNTIAEGYGDATIIKASATYVGVNTLVDATTNCQMIRNFNHSASSLTDSDIRIIDITFDWGSTVIVNGGAHCISMRYVDRPKVSGVRGINGENVTAFRACRDSLVEESHGLNQINCFFDHWEPSGNCKVLGCTGRSPDVNIAQGVQVNDSGNGTNTTALDFLVADCEFYRVRDPSGQSTAIAIGALDPGGFVRRARSINNYVEDADIGIVFSGGGGQHLSMCDTFRNVTSLPIFIQDNTGASPSGCRVIAPHLIDCDHAPINQAMIVFNGSKNEVSDLRVTNTGAAAYDNIAWFTPLSSNCFLGIREAPTGAGVRVLDGGANNRVFDELANGEQIIFTPALAFGGASVGITYSVQSGLYSRIGRLVFASIRLNLISKGTSTGNATIEGLPFAASTTGSMFFGVNVGSSANMSGTNTNLEGFISGSAITLRNGGTSTQLTDANFTNTSTLLVTAVYSAA